MAPQLTKHLPLCLVRKQFGGFGRHDVARFNLVLQRGLYSGDQVSLLTQFQNKIKTEEEDGYATPHQIIVVFKTNVDRALRRTPHKDTGRTGR